MGITANQVKFLKDNLLSKLGSERPNNNLPVVEQILADYAKEFLDTANANADKAGLTYKGTLQTDLTFKVTQNGRSYEIAIGYPTTSPAAEYYDFQNKGVAGVGKSIASPYSFKTMYPSRKMVTQILLWIRDGKNKSRFEGQTQNLSALQTKRKRLSDAVDSSNNFKALAYGTATNIKKNGIKQTLYFDNAITSTFNKDFVNVLSKALAADVSLKLIQTNGNNN
jgi:hypothetical protein